MADNNDAATPVATETPMETDRTVEENIDKILADGAEGGKYFSDFYLFERIFFFFLQIQNQRPH